MANAWIINDPATKSDAIVVLGGGLDYRPFAGAKLYNAGYSPTVLMMDVDLTATEQMGLRQSERDVTHQILLKQGVPEDAIKLLGHSVRNTYEESLAVRGWAEQNGARRLLIVTEIFHTRRVHWLFRKMFKGTGIEIKVVAVSPNEYGATNWWTREQGLIAFQNEWFKLPYYWVKY